MPITELYPDSIQQVCAACETTLVVAFANLTAGTKRDQQMNTFIIELPACTECGAREFLIRSPSVEEFERVTPGSYGHLHRLLVDRLHRMLVEANYIVEGADQQALLDLPRTDLDLEQWFPAGAKLPQPPAIESGATIRSKRK